MNINNLHKTDIDNDEFYLYVDAQNIENQINIKSIQVPLSLVFRKKLAWQNSLYFSAGLNFSVVNSQTVKVTGNSYHSGYYPAYNLIVDDATNYDFGQITYNDTYDFLINKFIVDVKLSAGYSFSLKSSGFLNLGVFAQKTISNLNYSSPSFRDDYVNIFDDISSPSFQTIGLSLSYFFKL